MIAPIREKAVSVAQQRLMGLAYSVKTGDQSLSDIEDPELREKVKGIVDSMSEEDLKKFAETKHSEIDEEAGVATPSNTVGISPDNSLPVQSGNTKRELTDEEIKAMFSSQLYQQGAITKFEDYYAEVTQKFEEALNSDKAEMVTEGKVKLADIVDSLIAFGYDPISIKKFVTLFNAQKEVSEDDLIYNLSAMGLTEDEIETILL